MIYNFSAKIFQSIFSKTRLLYCKQFTISFNCVVIIVYLFKSHLSIFSFSIKSYLIYFRSVN